MSVEKRVFLVAGILLLLGFFSFSMSYTGQFYSGSSQTDPHFLEEFGNSYDCNLLKNFDKQFIDGNPSFRYDVDYNGVVDENDRALMESILEEKGIHCTTDSPHLCETFGPDASYCQYGLLYRCISDARGNLVEKYVPPSDKLQKCVWEIPDRSGKNRVPRADYEHTFTG